MLWASGYIALSWFLEHESAQKMMLTELSEFFKRPMRAGKQIS